jgi:error-prone DNA polymerase
LGTLREEYPDEPVPPGKTAMQHLTDLTWSGAAWRYPAGVPPKVADQLTEELRLIQKMDYPNYFITVHDIVREARSMGILCQGRGSAANSSVCFCLGVTAIDPTEHRLLFTRFISENRGEPPDIDVDFEHEHREKVMQYVYERYGRDYAAICGTVIHYRPRSAIRDVGKALGLTEDVTSVLAGTVWGSWGSGLPEDHIRNAGLDPAAPEIARAVDPCHRADGFPAPPVAARRRFRPDQATAGRDRADRQRGDEGPHLHRVGQGRHRQPGPDEGRHPGAGHAERHPARFRHAARRPWPGDQDLADAPDKQKGVYDMLSKADSVGVFQVESRAQMSMLPRLKPNKFYDLVIEVAIVRPGPIQGDMVHPYLKRRNGPKPVEWPEPSPNTARGRAKGILGNTWVCRCSRNRP